MQGGVAMEAWRMDLNGGTVSSNVAVAEVGCQVFRFVLAGYLLYLVVLIEHVRVVCGCASKLRHPPECDHAFR